MERKLLLKGLGCANCAQKMEEQTKKLAGVKMAAVNFATGTMSLELAEEEKGGQNFKNILYEVKRL